ncbi:prepilin-type N-terminal cleavage/methylation domain-containing protein [Bradyrhizobium sp. Ai1a-2]|uniref:PulJ/GspJ family protein n=1 Tax=Bradyrhizobium sp. Ai1a-2 TaxID=196490 RepID=UPI00041E4FB5|nr:prepilin-type N-terminal cleavage/methylation domain-containing protein [Bradyrhizobium sp. Ai1a-2]
MIVIAKPGLPKSTLRGVQGFTLIEVLAALAIGSVVIVATAALIHNVALNFDRRTGVVGRADQMLLAIERLAADFAAARLVSQSLAPQSGGGGNRMAAFTGGPTEVKFVAAGGTVAGPQGEEVVSLTVEERDDRSQLVRRRAPWRGPRTPFETIALRDPVQMLEGKVEIAFAFGSLAADGTVTWSDTWSGQPLPPRLVRLSIRDRASGAELVPAVQFALRADAPISCARPGAKATCLTGRGSKSVKEQPAKEAEPAKDQQAGGRG